MYGIHVKERSFPFPCLYGYMYGMRGEGKDLPAARHPLLIRQFIRFLRLDSWGLWSLFSSSNAALYW